MRSFSTPMMQQYAEIKQQYSDSLLFYRLGDFYELFLDDALIGAKILGITLTRRPRGKDGDIPMAGVPFHAADRYISKLVDAGHTVAICEQVSDPNAKGIVQREVVRMVTPGTNFEDTQHTDSEKFVLGISNTIEKDAYGISFLDVTTGDFYVAMLSSFQELKDECVRISPKECILPPSVYQDAEILRLCADLNIPVRCFHDWPETARDGKKELETVYSVASLKSFGLDDVSNATHVAAGVYSYVRKTQQHVLDHLKPVQSYSPRDSLQLDASTIQNLELFTSLHGETQGSLFSIIDATQSAAGKRLLKKWMRWPLLEKKQILHRQNIVTTFVKLSFARESLRSHLKELYDIERILSRLAVGLATPGLIRNLHHSLDVAEKISQEVLGMKDGSLRAVQKDLKQNTCKRLQTHIDSHIVEYPEESSIGYIAKGVDAELDELKEILETGQDWLKKFEIKEREKTGISTLKCNYNKVFGYYIEVSSGQADKVPNSYQRKQTLVNAERFITPELKAQEEKILAATERITEREEAVFKEVVSHILSHTEKLQRLADVLAQLDCITAFATTAVEANFVAPTFSDSRKIIISQGRHPVVEHILSTVPFVPNDTHLGEKDSLHLLTGPNMAGKSVYMRQVALVVILAQMGSYVPAQAAELSCMDAVFVRSGAHDAISQGLSTFMVEMIETAYILRHMTHRSLIVFDEIGRGTSTYDGISIAWAVAEACVNRVDRKPLVLFATHYHELQSLAEVFPHEVSNYQMLVAQEEGTPVLLHTVVPGKSSHSFGIAVAKMAGVDQSVVAAAEEKLKELEAENNVGDQVPNKQKRTHRKQNKKSTVEDEIAKKVSALDISKMTPLEALQVLANLQETLRK